MPKLPSAEDLGGLPSARTGRGTGRGIARIKPAVPDIAVPNIAVPTERVISRAPLIDAENFQHVAGGLQKVADAFAHRQQERDSTEAIQAKAFHDKSLIALEREIESSPNFETYESTFNERVSGISNQALGMISNDTMRERWGAQFSVAQERSRNRILRASLKQDRANKESALESALGDHRDIFLAEDVDQEQRAEAITNARGSILGALDAGYITEAKAQRLKEKYVEGSVSDYTKILKKTDVPTLERELEDKDGLLADIDPVERAELQAFVVKEGKLNGLLVDIGDGKAGQAEIDAARKEWLTDFTDIRATRTALERREKVGTLIDASRAFDDPRKVWDPTDTDDKKRVDALTEANDGKLRFVQQEEGFFENTLAPVVEKTGMIPRPTKGVLTGMLRSNDQATVIHALQTMDQLERMNPVAFARDMGSDALKKVTRFREQLAFRKPEEIVESLQRSEDPSLGEARKRAESEGSKLAAKIPDEVILDHFDPSIFITGPDAPLDPLAGGQLRAEFDRLFAEEYAATGDASLAEESALKLLETVWGPSEVGGTSRLMRYPPERYFPAIDGSHDWMTEQAKEELSPHIGEKDFTLVGDRRTQSEIASGVRPTYAVSTRDEFGVFEAVPVRFTFDPKPTLEAKRETFEAKHEQRREDLKIGEGIVPAL